MKAKARIAFFLFITFSGLMFGYYCFAEWPTFGHFMEADNWKSLGRGLLFGMGSSVFPTLIVMLGVFSNQWFPRGFLANHATKVGIK
jgi:hypothetical protein